MAIGAGRPELVFCGPNGESLLPDSLSRDWRRICDRFKLPKVRFHDLRHTHASLLLAKGVPILAVSKRLGHERASTTLDRYGRTFGDADASAVAAISGILKG